jgi:hypothetical protein
MERSRNNPLLLLFISCCLLFDPMRAQISATVSIYSGPEYAAQRPCAQGCFMCPTACCMYDYECFANNFGCGQLDVLNQCFCRADLQPVAYSILSKCVNSACANTVDVQSALSIYTEYCATMASTLVMPSITSSAGMAIATAAGGTAQVVSVVTVTSTPVETTIIYKNSASGQSRCYLVVSLVSLRRSSSTH